jgi:UDP-N-acetylglucosamine--N-acetylmuramyl-(pentapeptide) pyrophosphoryl-undecaprenol N-acetylglucosamine transferase
MTTHTADRQQAERVPARRVVFQAPNTVGLGHISRLAAVALALRERDPDAAVLFAVEGDDHGLLAAAGLPRVSIPGLELLSDAWAMWPGADQGALTAGLADAFVAATRPDLVVFDCVPNWAFLATVRRRGVPFAVCLRKMKSEPLRGLLDQVRGADLVLVPHAPGEMDVPAELAARTRHVGRIVRPAVGSATPGASARVVVTGGGGGYPGTVEFYNAALEALEICRRADPATTALLVTGPLFKDWRRLRPASGVQVVPFEPDLAGVFAAADVVICQAGYNTVAEVASLGVAAICVPAERVLDDQHERARETAARHDRFQVAEDLDPARLAERIRRALAAGPAPARVALPAPGAAAAADALIEVIDATAGH